MEGSHVCPSLIGLSHGEIVREEEGSATPPATSLCQRPDVRRARRLCGPGLEHEVN